MRPLPLDPYIVDTLLPDLVGHDRQPSAFLVYLHLWRHAHAAGDRSVQTSLHQITAGTGLSKRAVQSALTRLSRRRLVSVSRASLTAVPIYTVRQPWAERRGRVPAGPAQSAGRR